MQQIPRGHLLKRVRVDRFESMTARPLYPRSRRLRASSVATRRANRDVPELNSIVVLLDSETSPIVEWSGGGLPHQAPPHGIFGAKTATLRNPFYW